MNKKKMKKHNKYSLNFFMDKLNSQLNFTKIKKKGNNI